MGNVRSRGFKLFDTVAVSSTTTYTSDIVPIDQMLLLGFQITFTSTATGTLSIKVSNDGVNFVSLGTTLFTPTLTQPAGSGLAIAAQVTLLSSYLYLRAAYTNSSGSGNMTVILSAKDLG